jgi:hypothetical protein
MAQLFRLNRALIGVSGPDALAFLDNLLTQNLKAPSLQFDAPRYGALLSAQGKVFADMILWPHAEGVLLEASADRGADLIARLSMYKLRAQVSLADASEALAVVWSESMFAGAAPDPRRSGDELGYRRLCPRQDAASSPDGASAFDAKRIAAGVPDLARDAQPEEVFALEALLEELNGVDFQKGCFIGQENVSRMKRRATTRKKFCPIVFNGAAIAYGTPIKAGEVEIGAVRTGMEGRAIALARLDRAIEASENGAPLSANGREIRLDPPDWLILPSREEG